MPVPPHDRRAEALFVAYNSQTRPVRAGKRQRHNRRSVSIVDSEERVLRQARNGAALGAQLALARRRATPRHFVTVQQAASSVLPRKRTGGASN